jgi:type II secretory pathway component PulK
MAMNPLRHNWTRARRFFQQRVAGRVVERVERLASRSRDERGLALIFVLSLTGVILAVLGEILFQSQITVRTSVGERDKVKAEMSALTGAQFAKMLVSIEAQMNQLSGEDSGLPKEAQGAAKAAVDMMKAQLGGKQLSQILDGFPIGAQGFEEIQDLAKLNINAMLDEKLLAALKAVPGYFVLKTTNESAKFNLNLLEGAEKQQTFKALKRILGQEREAKFLQDKGWQPDRLAANVLDYVDRDNTDEIDRGDESTQYSQAKFEHGPKNAKFESLEELRRVPGFHDDEIFNIFSPYFTVWPLDAKEKSLDVNAAPVELLAALVTAPTGETNEAAFDKIEDDRAENEYIKDARNIAEAFPGIDEETKQMLSRIGGIRSTVYRVEVRGVSNGIERVYTMIIETAKPKKGAPGNAPPTPPANPAAGTPPVAAPPGGANPPAAGAGGPSDAPIRVVYQRFQ